MLVVAVYAISPLEVMRHPEIPFHSNDRAHGWPILVHRGARALEVGDVAVYRYERGELFLGRVSKVYASGGYAMIHPRMPREHGIAYWTDCEREAVVGRVLLSR